MHVGSRSMKKRKLGLCRCYPASTKLMARAMAKRSKQTSSLEPAKGALAPPRGTWSQGNDVASARGVWHYPSRKGVWRSRSKFRCNGSRLTNRLRALLRVVGSQRGEVFQLREQAAQYQLEKRSYEAMIDRLQKDVDELNEVLGMLDATTQARMVEGTVLGFR